MAGRHRKPTNTGRLVARTGAMTVMAAAPLGIVGTALAAPAAPTDGTFDKLAHCESTSNWDADTGNGFKGGLQFTDDTWREFGGKEFAPSADQASREQQIAVAKKVQDQQGWKAWPKCSQKIGLR